MSFLDDLDELVGDYDHRPPVRCKSCGAVCYSPPKPTVHEPGCSLDRTVTAATRWLRRHPEVPKKRGKRRHAEYLAAGMCGNCGKNSPRPDLKTCEACAAYWRSRYEARR